MISSNLRIGDSVTVNIPKDNLEWGFGRDIHGKSGKVVGFNLDYRGYGDGNRQIGVYESETYPKVEIDGVVHDISSWHLDWVEIPENREKEEAKRISDLPETEFLPGDKVMDVSHKYDDKGDYFKGKVLTVTRINYHDIGKFCYDNVTPLPFICAKYGDSGCLGTFRDYELKLIERGNIWKFHHKQPLSFASIEEEAIFEDTMRRTTEIKNPRNDLYSWDNSFVDGKPFPQEALQALKDGIGHAMKMHNGFFGMGPSISVYRFENEELGEKVRQKTLHEFGM